MLTRNPLANATTTAGITGFPNVSSAGAWDKIAIDVAEAQMRQASAPCQLKRRQNRPSMEQTKRPDIVVDIILAI